MQTAEYPRYVQENDDWKLTAVIQPPKVFYGADRRDRVGTQSDLQMNLFGVDARLRVRNRLKEWYKLSCRVSRLREQIQKESDILRELRVDLPSIIQVIDDMPRASGVSDKTGNHVARKVDTENDIRESIADKRIDLANAEVALFEIESAVRQLDEDTQDILRHFFYLGSSWIQITDRLHISRNALYRRIDKTLDALADRL